MKRKLKKKNLFMTLGAIIFFLITIIVINFLFLKEKSIKTANYEKKDKPTVKVDFTNLHALITWNKLPEYNQYEIMRKLSINAEYKVIADININENLEEGSKCEYKDVYFDSFTTNEEKKLLAAKNFLDPSTNGVIYTVRGYKFVDNKKIYSDYYFGGDFHLETPSIISVEKNKSNQIIIEWGTVKNAQKYYLYSGYKDNDNKMHWKRIDEVFDDGSVRLKRVVNILENHNYFTVKAVALKNDELIFSDYDKGFSLENRKYYDKNILFFGDSITFGSPYKGKLTRDVFSYPYRVQQLTGVNFYNPSIPGATYTYNDRDNRSRMIKIADCLKQKRNVTTNDLTKKNDTYVYKTDFVDNQINGRTFSDFDVVIMAAGTNDYLDDAIFGDLNSQNINEMNGSLNTILSYIKEASGQREKEGKTPIKVVFVDLFYSDRTYDYSKLTNRFVTKNKIGLTLEDYQKNINSLIEKHKKDGMDIYQFETDKLINQENCPYVSSDNLHMTRYQYTQIGNALSEFLISNKII